MVQKYALYRIAHWLRNHREELSKLPLAEVKNRMIKEGLSRTASRRDSNQPRR